MPAVTLGFWIIKIAATTLGETGGDAVTMSMHLGYLVGTTIFAAIFVAAVAAQISAKKFHPFLYWTVIVATTTAGTTLADFVDRSLGIGYLGGSSILLALLLLSLAVWYRSLGTVSVESVTTPKAEVFYWATIMFKPSEPLSAIGWRTLRTWLQRRRRRVRSRAGDGRSGVLLTNMSRTFLFWAAFILARPLGATVGDFLDKPLSNGGMALSRYAASAVLAVFIVGCIALLPQRAGRHPA